MQEAWEERYRRGETGWDRGETSPALAGWLESGLLTPCRILVPGCGKGYEVVELARRGFEVTAVDIAPSPLKALKSALARTGGTAEVIQADLLQWWPNEPFDAIYEQTCLCALDPDSWPDYAQRLHAWLKPGGRLYALFMQTGRPGGPPFHCALEDMHRLFSPEHWQWPKAPHPVIHHPTGLHELAVILRRIP
ncbi:MAG: methyltransferase domain-containing protein [Gammaproteobacteria bacterium]|nr:MAG: methyltransferase domain-containing protein [Gammaproteobacteria bacterium]